MNSRSDNKNKMTFLNHLEELRWHLLKMIISVLIFSIISFFFADKIISFLIKPVLEQNPPIKLQVLSVQGMFILQIITAMITGIILSIPTIVYQLLKFIKPALNSNTFKYLLPSIITSFFFFLFGVAFSYYIILPIAIKFLINISEISSISTILDINRYTFFIIKMIVISGLIFQTPITTIILTYLKIITPNILAQKRRYLYVIIVVLAAIFTPPDPLSQLLIAIPFICLFEFSVLLSKLIKNK